MGSNHTWVEIAKLDEATSLQINSGRFKELLIRNRALALRDLLEGVDALAGHEEIFGDGPASAITLRVPDQPDRILLVGEEGAELLALDIDSARWTRVAELARFPNDVGGMRRLEALELRGVVLLHWEVGVLCLGPSLELRWHHDLDWNHTIVSLDDSEVWFDLLYESDEVQQRIGEQPWGYSVPNGRELFDRTPPVQ